MHIYIILWSLFCQSFIRQNNAKKHIKKSEVLSYLGLAGVEGIEPSAYGFGDRRSTS